MVHCKAASRVDQGPLVGEMPDAGAPVLKIDISQPGPAGRRGISIAPQCRPGAAASRLAVSASSVASAPSSKMISVVPRSTPAARKAERCAADGRSRRPGARRAPFRPTSRRRARRRTYRRGIDRRKQIRPQQVSVRTDQLVQATEQDALPGQRGVEVGVEGAAIQRSGVAGEIDARGEEGVDRLVAVAAPWALKCPALAQRAARNGPAGSRGCRSASILRAFGRDSGNVGMPPRPAGAASTSQAGSWRAARNDFEGLLRETPRFGCDTVHVGCSWVVVRWG